MMEERQSEFYLGQSVLVGLSDEPKRTAGVVTDLIEIHYHNCPSGIPGQTWWPQITLKNGVKAVFCPEMVRPATNTNTNTRTDTKFHIIIESDVSRYTLERIQEFLNDPDPEPGAGFSFNNGHFFDAVIDADSVKFQP